MMLAQPWKPHGMGVATRILWQSPVADIRLHWWSDRFKTPNITYDTGAIHWHSFNMFSRVLRGRVRNTILGFNDVFPADIRSDGAYPIASGEDIWSCWKYEDGIPSLISQGYVTETSVVEYAAGDTFRMKAGQFHYYEPLGGDALTIVYRRHVNLPNLILTTGNKPVNGRK